MNWRPAAWWGHGSDLEKKIETEPPALETASISYIRAARGDFPQGPLGSHRVFFETSLVQRHQKRKISILICQALPVLGPLPPEPRFCYWICAQQLGCGMGPIWGKVGNRGPCIRKSKHFLPGAAQGHFPQGPLGSHRTFCEKYLGPGPCQIERFRFSSKRWLV